MRLFACLSLIAAFAGGCDRNVALAGPTDGGQDAMPVACASVGGDCLGPAIGESCGGHYDDRYACAVSGARCCVPGAAVDMAENGAGCVANGGMCMSDAPGACQGGTIKSGVSYACDSIDGGGAVICCFPQGGACNLGNDPLPCSDNAICEQNGAVCDQTKHSCVCPTPNCTPGQDQTCNYELAMSSFAGHCNSAGSCQCNAGFVKDPSNGKCRPACPSSAPSTGDACTSKGQSCSYLPNTTCTCNSLFEWQCAL
jgi:hypothetical protein